MTRSFVFRPLAVALALAAGPVLPLVVPASAAAPAEAAIASGTPEASVQQFYDTLLSVMKNASALGYQGRYKTLAPAVKSAFDLPLMTRLAIGPAWGTIKPDEQTRLVDAFTRFTIASYASQFDGYSGEKFQVGAQKPAGSGAVLLDTKLIQSSGEPVQLNYLMHQSKGDWRIVDVYLSGTISQLATRRSEFSSVLQRDGASGLVSLMNKKIEAMSKS